MAERQPENPDKPEPSQDGDLEQPPRHDARPEVSPGASELDAPPLGLGTVIRDRYRIDGLLATGGVGVVYRAEDLELHRGVAIKMLLTDAAGDEEVRARFELEGRLAGRIRSEHVARVLDVGKLASGAQFMVLELLEGEDLDEIVRKHGRLEPPDAVELVIQACEALAEAHALGIVHRDMKLANLFLTERPDGSPCVKVIDFGLAKTTVFSRAGVGGLSLGRGATLIGTPRNMAPEQISGKIAVDERTDVYALGTVLYELLSGSRPFTGNTIGEIFAQILTESPPPLVSCAPGVPQGLAAVVERCLEKDAAARYHDVGELALALAPFAPERARISADRAARVLQRLSGRGTEADRESITALQHRPSHTFNTFRPVVGARPRGRFTWRAFAFAGVVLAAVGAVAAVLAVRRGADIAVDAPCGKSRDCGSLSCIRGLCTRGCAADPDCPEPARCMPDGYCARPLRAAFLYVGVPQDGGWTETHDRGRLAAAAKLPFLETDFASNVHESQDAERAIDRFVTQGFDVIVANSQSLAEPVARKAAEHQGATFLVYGDAPPAPGVASFGGRMEAAWHLAGVAAARTSKTGRLGFVASEEVPEVVRFVNAFTLGARRVRPTAVVEVRWVGYWFDAGPPDASGRYLEERLTTELLATGCDVVANSADNARVVETVEAAGGGARSIGHDHPEQCTRAGRHSCIGAAAWNWGPLYTQIFEERRRHAASTSRFMAELRSSPSESVVDFLMNPEVASSNLRIEVDSARAELANDPASGRVFRGPYCSTGQRSACVPAGQSLTDDELRSMCWFVEGVVEKPGGAAATPDQPARVPEACTRGGT